jgi:hypothetical protein
MDTPAAADAEGTPEVSYMEDAAAGRMIDWDL